MKGKNNRNELLAEDIDNLCEDYRRGSGILELADAYCIGETLCYKYLKAAGLIAECKTQQEMAAHRVERRKVRRENRYDLDEDISRWLRKQPDIAKVINDALRLYKTTHG